MRTRAASLAVALTTAWSVAAFAQPAADPAPPAAAPPTPAAAAPPPIATISPRNAEDHIGEEVIVEGRVQAVHVSHLATVLGFTPNFSGFTATIHAADRPHFPKDLPEATRDRAVRLRGRISTYRGRVEMTLTDPQQLEIVDTGEVAEPPARNAPPSDEVRDALARIERRLDDLERRLATMEQGAAAGTVAQPATLAVGMSAQAAEALLGPPLDELADPAGLRVWLYEDGRTVTLDGSARVIAWSGF